MKIAFEKNYYNTGNYTNYLKRKFSGLADDLITALPLFTSHKVIDFGCGFGGLMWELRRRGVVAIRGTDISQWAIDYGKEQFQNMASCLHYYDRNMLDQPKDWVLMLDVLEHMPDYEIGFVLALAKKQLRKGIVVRIPVAKSEGEEFMLPVSNNDRTHITCHCRQWWNGIFENYQFKFDRHLGCENIYDSEGVLAAIYR